MNEHFRPIRNGLGCGCESNRMAMLNGSESAPESQCQCAASDDNKRQVINDLLMLISIGTALYAIFKKGKS